MNNQTALEPNASRALTLFKRQKIDVTIHDVTALVTDVEEGVDKLRDNDDKAAAAGYTPENVTLLGDWFEKFQSLRDEVDIKTEHAQSALDSKERLDAVQAELQALSSRQPLASTSRDRAKVVFVWLLENIPQFFHLVRALGTDVSPEIKTAIQQAADIIGCDPNSQLALPRQTSPESQSNQTALNEEIEKLKGKVEELEVEAGLNEGTYHRMTLERDARRKECLNLKADVAKITYKRDQAEERETNLRDRIKRQERELARYHSMVANEDLLAELRQENKVLRECKTALEDKVADLEKQKATSGVARTSLEGEITDLREQIKLQKSVRVGLEKERADLLPQVNIVSFEAQRGLREAAVQVRDSEERCARLEMDSKLQSQDIESKDRIIADLADQVETLSWVISTRDETISQHLQAIDAKAETIISRNRTIERHEDSIKQLIRSLDDRSQMVEERQEMIQVLNESAQEDARKIARLNETVSNQARTSDLFLRLVSTEHEPSEIWRVMVDRVSQNPTVATQLEIRPWKILPSWSTELVLAVESDGHAIYVTVTDIMAILLPGSSVAFLLRRLNALQETLTKAHQLYVAVLEMVIGCFADSMADPRLHAMHRLVMCQIAALVYPANDDRLVAVEQATLAIDPRIASLSRVLRAWDGIWPFPLDNCLEYPDRGFVLVGFGNGSSILAVDIQKHGLFWVDEVINNLREAHCQSPTGQRLSLPIDDADKLRWFIRHTKIVYKP